MIKLLNRPIFRHFIAGLIICLGVYLFAVVPLQGEINKLHRQIDKDRALIAELSKRATYHIENKVSSKKLKDGSTINLVPSNVMQVDSLHQLQKLPLKTKKWWQFWKRNNKKTKAMNKDKLQELANEVFKAHDFEKVYMTSDGQAFTEEQYATDHARLLKDRKVYSFDSEDVKVDASQDHPFDYEKIDRELLEDRAFLIARYEALEGKKPAHNIGTENLAEKVQELEKERFSK